MSNTIKLKRGSGSDPSASDLVVGELALRTDNGKIFTKKDNGTVAEISGGGGIDDGDKGDITVSNSGDTFTIDNGVVTSAKIADATIVNADINSSAAIAGTKISPDFGSQNVATTGTLASGDLTLTDVSPSITFTDSNDNPDFSIFANSGELKFKDDTNDTVRMKINSDGHVDVVGNLDVGAGIDVTGDIIASGDITANGGDFTISGSTAVLHLTDTNNDDDFSVMNENGVFIIRDATNSANRISVNSSGVVNIPGNTDFGDGIDVTGNITSTGTIGSSNITITNSQPFLSLQDSDNENDFEVGNAGGLFRIRDVDAATNRLTISSAGVTTIAGNLDVGAGIDVTGHATVSQSLTVTGTTSLGETVNITGNDPNITFVDSNNNPDFKIFANAGTFLIHDYTNSNDILKVQTDGHLDITPHTDFAAGIDVTGNITVTGTVDGRDVASDGTKLDGIESGATADQSNSEIKTAYEANSNTNAFTDALLSKLNGIAASATNVTNNNQLTNGAGYITATLTNEQVQDIVGGMVSGNTESGITVTYQDGDGTLDFSVASQTDQNFTTTLKNKLDGIAAGATNVTNNNQISNGAGYLTSVGTSNIANDAITQAKIADDAVGTDQIATSSITTNRLAADAVTGAKIADDAVDSEHLANGCINNSNFFSGTIVNSAALSSNAVTTAKIANSAVTNAKIDSMAASKLTGALPAIDGSNLTGISAGATGGGSDEVFYENDQTVTTNYTITNGKNAMAAGPITINSGVTVTVGSGETLTIV